MHASIFFQDSKFLRFVLVPSMTAVIVSIGHKMGSYLKKISTQECTMQSCMKKLQKFF